MWSSEMVCVFSRQESAVKYYYDCNYFYNVDKFVIYPFFFFPTHSPFPKNVLLLTRPAASI